MKKKPSFRCLQPGRGPGARKAPKPKKGQKTVHVPYATGNSGVKASAPVTMPKLWND